MSTRLPQGTGDPHTASISEEPERIIMGRSVRTSNAAELDAAPGESLIEKLWMEFGTGDLGELVLNHHDSHEIIMAYSDFENGAEREYTCTLGFRVSSHDAVPDGLSACVMPAQTYAVVPVGGDPAETISATWIKILELFTPGYHLKRSFRCDADVFPSAGTAAEMNPRILIGIETGDERNPGDSLAIEHLSHTHQPGGAS